MGPKFDPTAITIGMVWFFLMLMMCTARFDIFLQVASQLRKNIQLANRLILSCVTSQLPRYIAKYANQCQQDIQVQGKINTRKNKYVHFRQQCRTQTYFHTVFFFSLSNVDIHHESLKQIIILAISSNINKLLIPLGRHPKQLNFLKKITNFF